MVHVKNVIGSPIRRGAPLLIGSVLGAAIMFGSAEFAPAKADAVIYNTGSAATGTVALGVVDFGQLNTSVGNIAANAGATGLAAKFADGSWRDATSPGCLWPPASWLAEIDDASSRTAAGGTRPRRAACAKAGACPPPPAAAP